MSPTQLYRKARRVRWIKTLIALVLIAVGAITAKRLYGPARILDLERYKYGEWNVWSPAFTQHPLGSVSLQLSFLVGYALVLIGFAYLFRWWAPTATSRVAARYVLAAAFFTVLADGVTDIFLHRFPGPGLAATVVSAAATIKWCAALPALGGIAVVVGMGLRGTVGWIRTHILPRIYPKMRENAEAKGLKHADWWKKVWAEPKRPDIELATLDKIQDDETSWFKAYSVPDAVDVLEAREGAPVQAICLSGGGVRSACIAMGATQVFADPKLGVVKQKSGALRPLIDTVDYVISVSGGGFTAAARLLATHPPNEELTPDVTATEQLLLSDRFGEGSAEFDHFRRGSSYLFDTPAELAGALAVVLKNLIASLAILFTLPAALGWIFGYLSAVSYFSFATFVPLQPQEAHNFKTNCRPNHAPWQEAHATSWWAVGFFVGLALLCVAVAVLLEWTVAAGWSERWRLSLLGFAQGSTAFAVLVLVLALVAGLPELMLLCSKVDLHAKGWATIVSGVIGLNYVAAIFAMATRKGGALPLTVLLKPSWWRRLLPPTVLRLTVLLLTFVLLASAWLIVLGSFAVAAFKQAAPYACGDIFHHPPVVGCLLLLAVLILGFGWGSPEKVDGVSLLP